MTRNSVLDIFSGDKPTFGFYASHEPVGLGQSEQVFWDGVGLGLHSAPCHAKTPEHRSRGFDFCWF